MLERAAIIGWKADFRRDEQVGVVFDLVSTAGAQALGIGNYGITVGGAANLSTIAASCVAEAVAAHPPRRLALFDGKIVARHGAFLASPVPIASVALI
jgi:cytosine/creatinine deaminase